MNYGLTIYGPLVDTEVAREALYRRLLILFDATAEQIRTAWETMRNFPDFNSVEVIKRRSGDLLVHVYYSPIDVPADADCAFHAKITPKGMYE